MSIRESVIGRNDLCIARGSAEPTISARQLVEAISPKEIEQFRPLLPVGYAAGVAAYQSSLQELTARQLTTHYTDGLEYFHQKFVPLLKQRLQTLTGNNWSLDDHLAFAAGSDVDFMTHLVEAVSASEPVALYPGDWFGFRVGCTHDERIVWDATGKAALACLCVPSVRNGHVTESMVSFLRSADACLLNLNLLPTLSQAERSEVAQELSELLPKSVLSISFSRGFGLTASQLGVALVPKTHPFCMRFERQWKWLTFFYNAIAARAFQRLDVGAAEKVDRLRQRWVEDWLADHDLPVVSTGTYYVKAFRVAEPLPEYFAPLKRGNVVRLCFKPPQT